MIVSKRVAPSVSSSNNLKEFINYNHLQQFNCIKIRCIQQTEQHPLLRKDHSVASSTDDSRNAYLKFYQPYKKFMHRHKIIQKNKAKPKVKEERNHAGKVMKRMPVAHLKAIHDDSFKIRQNNLEFIFNWMMEFASLLKITKNAYFRAILILQRAIQADNRIVSNNRIAEYACAALSIGIKYECNRKNYLSQIIVLYSRKISKIQILNAENGILAAIKWRIPVHILLEEDLSEMLRLWTKFLKERRGEFQRNLYIKCFHDSEDRLISKLYIEIVYVLDFLIIKRSQEWLKEDAFVEPILIALYILFSINVGDVHLDQYCLWPHFERFLNESKLYQDTTRIKLEISRCFSDYKIIEVLGEIPLNLNFEKVIKKRNEQFYIPKIEWSL